MTTEPTPRFSARAIVLTLALGLAGGATVMWVLSRAPSSPAAEEPDEHAKDLPPGVVEVGAEAQKNAEIQVLAAAASVVPVNLELTGAVTVDDARVAHVRPLGRGVVEQVSVRLGDRVKRGQTLATYDNVTVGELVGEYLSGRAALRQGEADRDVKRQALARARELIKVEAISQAQLEVREAEYRSAEAAVVSAEAVLARAAQSLRRFGLSDETLQALNTSSSDNPHRGASHTVLRAPFDGIVTSFNVAVGEVLESDRELFAVSDLTSVWVQAEVYERDLARIRVGTEAIIRVDTYPDRVFKGRVTYISDVIDPETRTAKVRCVVANNDGALKLDMFAKVSIPTTEKKEALSVPEAAIQQIDGRPVVFVRQSETRFVRRSVDVGSTAGGLVEIRSGLKAGEDVVGSGSFYLKTALLRERVGDAH